MSPEEKNDRTEDAERDEAAEPPKRRRTRAKAKPAEKAEAEADAPAAEEEKPKRSRARARKPKAETAAEARAADESADAPVAADDAGDEEAAAPAKPARRPAKPAPARKRGAAEPATAPPVVRARARYVRSSARKARLVCDHIRGKDVDEARAILRYAPRAVARDWAKLLESAVANAEHNHELVGDDLRIAEAYADEGPTLKRFRPRAMGRATRIRKRTSHLTITLTPKEDA